MVIVASLIWINLHLRLAWTDFQEMAEAWDATRYLTMQQGAELLRCSDQTVTAKVKAGRLPGLDLGEGSRPRWLVDRAAVEILALNGGAAPGSETVATLRSDRDRLLGEVGRLTERLLAAERSQDELRRSLAKEQEAARGYAAALEIAAATAKERYPESGSSRREVHGPGVDVRS